MRCWILSRGKGRIFPESRGASMQRTIWEWIVRMDDRIGDVMLDAGIAIALAAVGTAVLRSLIAYL
jgi:hypothetical protein